MYEGVKVVLKFEVYVEAAFPRPRDADADVGLFVPWALFFPAPRRGADVIYTNNRQLAQPANLFHPSGVSEQARRVEGD